MLFERHGQTVIVFNNAKDISVKDFVLILSTYLTIAGWMNG